MRSELKALYDARQAVEAEIALRTREVMAELEKSLEPLREQYDAIDDQMNALLGEHFWIEGCFSADGLPEIDTQS